MQILRKQRILCLPVPYQQSSRRSAMRCVSLALAGSAFAADVDGWTGAVNTPNGDFPVTFEFKAEGAMLNGCMLGMACDFSSLNEKVRPSTLATLQANQAKLEDFIFAKVNLERILGKDGDWEQKAVTASSTNVLPKLFRGLSTPTDAPVATRG